MEEEKGNQNKTPRVLEVNKRFSDSILWQLQNDSYTDAGPEAWMKGVPFYITSNPLIARSYASIVLAFIKDCIHNNSGYSLDIKEPLYIFDLGAGTGRFAYLFLKELLPLLKELLDGKLKLRYILTDFVPQNFKFLKEHPFLKEYFEDGILDSAIYKHGQRGPIVLENSTLTMGEGSIKNPFILIANYFFDVLPQDLFKIQDHKIFEGLLTSTITPNNKTHQIENFDPQILPHLTFSYEYMPIKSKNYYSYVEANEILFDYEKLFKEAIFLLPRAAFDTIDFFSRLSGGRLMLVAGDQGVSTLSQVERWGEPKISCQGGAFSFAVCYEALARFFIKKKGVGLLSAFSQPSFITAVGILGENDEKKFPETKNAYQRNIESFEPSDYWRLVEEVNKLKNPSLNLMLTLVKLGNWDPINFHYFYDKIRKYLPKCKPDQKENVVKTIKKVSENFFPINKDEGDFLLNLGVMLFELKEYESALSFFQKSVDIGGEKPLVWQNMAACYVMLNDQKNVLVCLERAKK